MIPLKDYNEAFLALYRQYGFPTRHTGIECPCCAAELLDTQPPSILPSDPPQSAVSCSECSFTGFRIA